MNTTTLLISRFSFKRLGSTIHRDIQLQVRNGFYYAAAFVGAIWVLLFSQLKALDLGLLFPALLLNNLLINTFYFIGGLVLLEKAEGSLEAQVVTPLRTWEYLASKVITLTLLSLLENLTIIGLVYGLEFNVLVLVLGASGAAAIYTLLGFIAVARYDSINEYLMPSMLYTLVFSLPVLPYFGLLKSPLFYLHPLQAPLILLQAAFRPVEPWQWVYGLAYTALWIGLIYRYSRKAFVRFVIAREGVR